MSKPKVNVTRMIALELAAQGPVTAYGLAGKAGISHSAAARCLRQLLEDGLVESEFVREPGRRGAAEVVYMARVETG